jgi:hypothetical protein
MLPPDARIGFVFAKSRPPTRSVAEIAGKNAAQMAGRGNATLHISSPGLERCKSQNVTCQGSTMDDMTEFRVTYDGPALANHEMDPRELAPALLAVAELLESSAKVLFGENVKLKINVKGSFQTGSFNIDFVTGLQWLKSIRDLFAGENAAAVANGLAILTPLGFFGAKGVAQLLVWLDRRKITRVEVLPEVDGMPRQARIYVGEAFCEVEKEAVDLLRDVGVRKAFDKVLAPLDRAGVDTFAVGQGVGFNLVVVKEERAAFDAPDVEEDLLIDDTRRMVFSIISLAFKEDNKWRLSDGAATISATISDQSFLDDVNSSVETFAKGDVLVCTVRVKQWQTQQGARTDYEVIKVEEHRHAARQIRIEGLDMAH